MKKDKIFREFCERVKRGRKFEEWERSHWNSELNSAAEFEAPTKWEGKRGRIDIKLKLEEDGNVVIVEIKATNWDKIKESELRSTALRHSRQIWRYIEEIPDLVASTAFEDFPLMSYWESSFSKVAEVVTAALE